MFLLAVLATDVNLIDFSHRSQFYLFCSDVFDFVDSIVKRSKRIVSLLWLTRADRFMLDNYVYYFH